MSMNPEGFRDRPVPVRPLDEAQARLLEILRAAGGRPVTFAELREHGLDNPAVLCYELEIAGLPITHVERSHLGGAPVPVGVQLDEEALAAPEAPEPPPPSARLLGLRGSIVGATATAGDRARSLAGRAHEWARTDAREAAARLREHRRQWDPDWESSTARRSRTGLLLGATAVAIVIALVIGLASGSGSPRDAASLSGGRHRARTTSSSPAAHPAARLATHSSASSGAGAAAGTNGSPRTPPSEDASRALQLQGAGHQLLAEGRYAAAAADLEAAIAASGGSPARCAEPSTESCLAYAYALYDLGRALQAQHKPGAAVPILNKRLRIDNQRATVRAQLNSARKQMHASTPRTVAHHHKQANAHAPAHSPAPTTSHGEAKGLPSGPEASGEQPQTPTSGARPQSEEGGGPPPASPSGGEAAPPGSATNG